MTTRLVKRAKVDPQQKVGLVPEIDRGQAEASTLLHESSNSKPETIEQGEIVFHYIRVGIARVGVIPLVGTKPATIDKEQTHRRLYIIQMEIRQDGGRPTWGDGREKTEVRLRKEILSQNASLCVVCCHADN